jgi:hypothetical protein
MPVHSIYRFVLCLSLLAPSLAYAQEEEPPAAEPGDQGQDTCGPERPWYDGVTPEQREQARSLYKAGNLLLDDLYYREAAVKYRQALEHWDNPPIHYNLMIALIGDHNKSEAYKSAVAALQYDGCALTPKQRHRARENREIFADMLSWITVECQVRGASVFLDEDLIFVGPGKVTLLVRDGEHRVLATKKNHMTTRETIKLQARQHKTVLLEMLHNDKVVLTSRRWQAWKPYAVMAAGVGLGLVGSAFQWRSSENNQQYSALFTDQCPPPGGCLHAAQSSELLAVESRYKWYRRVGIGTLAASGAIAATGVVLWYFNRPEKRPNPRRDDLVHITVTPTLAPDATGAAITGRF